MYRIEYCKNFAKSMNKIESDQTKIRVKEPIYLENIADMFERINERWSKYHRKAVNMYMLDNEKYCCASGILFIKATLSNLSIYSFKYYYKLLFILYCFL